MDSILNNIDALFTVQDLFNGFFEEKNINKHFVIKPLMENMKGFGGLKKLTVDINLATSVNIAKIKSFIIKGTDENKIYINACKKLATELTLLMLVYGTE